MGAIENEQPSSYEGAEQNYYGEGKKQLRRQRCPSRLEFEMYRTVATRYDKLARNFLAAIALASIRLRLRHYESTT